MKFFKEQSNYDKRPIVDVIGYDQACWAGWAAIATQFHAHRFPIDKPTRVMVVECYVGTNDDELLPALVKALSPDFVFHARDAMKSQQAIADMTYPDVTDDEVFGYLTRLHIDDFFDGDKLSEARAHIRDITAGTVLVYGSGASLLADADLLVFADMPRWEGQLRFRRNEVGNLGIDNRTQKASLQYKRAFFVDWRVCDRLKKTLMPSWDYVLDTTVADHPRMVSGQALREGLGQVVTRPFRVVPFFDPGPWGGQWMKEACGLDPDQVNYAWCFDCVPEENSLLLRFGTITFETPAINVVFFEPRKLLGEPVYRRFGPEFPIRFDFLDTMDGGNLSLQVHPTTEYIQEHFGMHYTQDESYYMLEASADAYAYLGLKETIQQEQFIADLEESQVTGVFDVGKHVAKWPVRKHDHLLIPAGTVHCSGVNGMVLEISATPYIFTFKLWDWGRMGMDGMPRPINIHHGKQVIDWDQTTSRVSDRLINRVTRLAEGDGWVEERTGLHEGVFIETRRHWFSEPVDHDTAGIVNVLNLVEGREALVESPVGAFEPFVVHYAETFIIPAAVGRYRIRPVGERIGQRCATIKAFVRTNP